MTGAALLSSGRDPVSRGPARAGARVVLACLACRLPLRGAGEDGAGILAASAAVCPSCGERYQRTEGIWRFLAKPAATRFDRFRNEYAAVRREEGRGAADPAYFQALPFQDTTRRFTGEWRIRRRSYAAFLTHVLAPLEQGVGRPLGVLDLGAGNGWMSYRLAARGHAVAAVDLSDDARDGLGVVRLYPPGPAGGPPFAPVQATFEALPFAGGTADLVIFNASFHYATSYEATLTEALRATRGDGRIVIMDSPLYRDPTSGRRMLEDRAAEYRRRFGFASDALPSEGFLTYDRLDALAAALGLHWRVVSPRYGPGWALRRLLARLRGGREPAAFRLLVAERKGGAR